MLDIIDQGYTFEASSDYQKFVAGVAAFAMLLRQSSFSGKASYDNILEWQRELTLSDPYGFKSEFQELVQSAGSLD